jgi:hypothetical protein
VFFLGFFLLDWNRCVGDADALLLLRYFTKNGLLIDEDSLILQRVTLSLLLYYEREKYFYVAKL